MGETLTGQTSWGLGSASPPSGQGIPSDSLDGTSQVHGVQLITEEGKLTSYAPV